MHKKTIKKICATFGVMAFFLCFMGISTVYAETGGDPDYHPGNNPSAQKDIANALKGPDTGTGILGNTLFKNAMDDPRELTRNVIFSVLGVLGTLMVVLIIYGGFLWATASGEEEKIQKAQHYLRNAIVGAILVMSAWTISIFVLEALKKAAT